MKHELIELIESLAGVQQSRKFHPEGDAMFHTLQVFERALDDTRDPRLLAAALLHDVGKAIDGPTHDIEGASLLEGLVRSDVVWLVEHHLDLLREPARAQKRFAGDERLALLQRLRRYDLAGRDPAARVRSAEWAVDTLLEESLRQGRGHNMLEPDDTHATDTSVERAMDSLRCLDDDSASPQHPSAKRRAHH